MSYTPNVFSTLGWRIWIVGLVSLKWINLSQTEKSESCRRSLYQYSITRFSWVLSLKYISNVKKCYQCLTWIRINWYLISCGLNIYEEHAEIVQSVAWPDYEVDNGIQLPAEVGMSLSAITSRPSLYLVDSDHTAARAWGWLLTTVSSRGLKYLIYAFCITYTSPLSGA
jgi:hypothetical protein